MELVFLKVADLLLKNPDYWRVLLANAGPANLFLRAEDGFVATLPSVEMDFPKMVLPIRPVLSRGAGFSKFESGEIISRL